MKILKPSTMFLSGAGNFFALVIFLMGLIVVPVHAVESEVICDEVQEPQALNYGDNTSGCAIDPDTDVDEFTFEGASGTQIRLILHTVTFGFDPHIEIRNPSGTVVADESCRADSAGALCSFMTDLDLTSSGTYHVAISEVEQDQTGSYQLSLHCLAGNCPGAPALMMLPYDDPVEDAISPAADMDTFSFEGASGTSVRFIIHTVTFRFDPRIEVRDPNGAVIANEFCRADSAGALCSFMMDLNLTVSGIYQVSVMEAGFDNSSLAGDKSGGEYQLSLNCLVGSCPGAPALSMLPYDDPVEDAISLAADMDTFSFEGSSGTSVRFIIHTVTFRFDPRVEVRDPNGAVIANEFCRADSAGALCSFMTDLNLTISGTYQVSVLEAGFDNSSLAGDKSGGDYQLSLNCLVGSCPGAPVLLVLLYDDPVEDTINPAADMDIFSFGGVSGTSIRIVVEGLTERFDPRAEVRDPSGSVIANEFCSADSPGLTCSFETDLDLIVSGNYQVAVLEAGFDNSSFAGGKLGGDYRITLICLSGDCPEGPVNNRPEADAGDDQQVCVGDTVTLDGSGSSDPDGDDLTYLWSFASVPSGSTASLSDPTAVNPMFDVDVAGEFLVELVVNDGFLDSVSDAISVIGNSPPTAGADTLNAEPISVGDTVMLSGSGSTDPDGDELTFHWKLTPPEGSTASLSDPTMVHPTFEADKNGDYEVELVVNDGCVDSEPDLLTVSTVNTVPEAQIDVLNLPIKVEDTVLLDGSGSSDIDGDPLTYHWMLEPPISSNASLSDPLVDAPTFVADKAGEYTVTLTVEDPFGGSDAVSVTISTVNTAPVAEAGPDQTVFVGDVGMLDGSGSSDVDGDNLTYQWSIISNGCNMMLFDPTLPKPTFLTEAEGLCVVQLIVNDSMEDSVPDTVEITAMGIATPQSLLVDLIAKVRELDAMHGIINANVSKLEAALAVLSEGNEANDGAAIRILGAFINSVSAQSGKHIDSEDAAGLMQDAQTIIDLLIGL